VNKERKVVRVAALAVIALVAFLLGATEAGATWKPEYANQHPNVSKWFQDAQLTPAAKRRLKYDDCCKNADRLRTKVIPAKDRDGEDVWLYYANPNCIKNGCKLAVIPADTIHDDPIPGGSEFAQLRAEGVLFIYDGKVTCFWKPEAGD